MDKPVTAYKLELFYELSPDLLCIAGYDGFFKRINPAVSNLLGYTSEELYARPINDFVYSEDKDTTAKVRKELTRNKPLYNFENRYMTKSGEIVWLSWTSFPVPEDEVIFAIAKNITHKKKQEEDRNALLANLTQINKDLTQLSYTTSHDLRSPVNNMLSLFELMDTSKIKDAETLKFLEMLKFTGEKLRNTLNGYVDVLSRQNRLNADMEVLSLEDVLKGVLSSVSSLIKTSKAEINIDFSKLEKVNFNRACLESIFLNLITNAIKYARPDRSPVISLRSEKADGIVRLIISDNGLGFDMEKVKGKIFGLHQKFHNHIDSKGIGLYIVQNHVTSLGGSISVTSQVNEGTEFVISLKD
ncbi:MAG: sensor histidine kinase [Bacteroidetes bacterium]|nr:sensor histidine kinase [Bacteroidota bacterium]